MGATTAFRVRVRHPEAGVWVGAVDAHGRWLALVPEAYADDSRAPADAGAAARAQREFEHWCATGEAPPVDAAGTVFRRRVWAAVSRIPRGETRTYAELAREVGCASARAVGGAVGANPVGLFIPCHRVCGARGALTGYAWGVALKARLLAWERALGLLVWVSAPSGRSWGRAHSTGSLCRSYRHSGRCRP